MSKAENVINYYTLCNKLKCVVRTGWKKWNVSKDRLESIAEHIYGTQMLALAMWSEYKYDIDITKVLFMLAIHELGEIKIGDYSIFDIDKKSKEEIEHDAVHEILNDLLSGEQIEALFLEFDAKETKEAKFAYWCDKLECDLQASIYGDDSVDLNNQENNSIMKNESVKQLLAEGNTWSEMWIKYGLQSYDYDENFREVSECTLKNISRK